MNKPKIRFKGFEGEWKERKIGDALSINSGRDYKHLEEGDIPVYGTGGYMLSVNERISDCDAIGIGRKGTIDKPQYLRAPFWTVDTLFFLTAKVGIDLDFAYNLSQVIGWRKYDESTGVPSLSKNNIEKIPISLPSLPEQRALASYFASLDAQIAASTSRLSSLKQIKAASLLNMFPQKGETVPRVRFKGFQGEWDSPSIEDVFEIRNGYTPSKSVESYWIGGTIPWFRMEDIRASGGFLEDSIQHITPQAVKNNGLFEKGSIIMATTATIGVHAQLIADSLANQQFTNFSIRKSQREGIIAKYAYYAFFGIDEWAVKNTNSGGLLSVNMPLLLKQPFFVPSLSEQRAIASFFTALDAQITLHRERLEKLKQIKAVCLEKLFA